MGGIYFIGGSEPYLVDCQKISLTGKLSVKELNYMEADAFTENVYQFLYTYPMGDDRKVAYISVAELSDMNVPLFKEYRNAPSEFGVLIVRFRALDARTKFFHSLKNEGLLHLFDKESATLKLSEFIERRVAKKGAAFSNRKALDLFISRENYANRKDITLYNIVSDLNNLIALSNTITEEMIVSVVPDNLKDNVFGIASQIIRKDINGLRSQALLCRGNEIGTLSALLREYRISYKALYFPLKDIGASKNIFKELSKEQLIAGINIITDAVDAFKAKSMPESVILEHTFLKLIQESGK